MSMFWIGYLLGVLGAVTCDYLYFLLTKESSI